MSEASGSGTESRARVCETQRDKERIRKRKWDLKGSNNMVSVQRQRERILWVPKMCYWVGFD